MLCHAHSKTLSSHHITSHCPLSPPSNLIIFILINLPRHHHHPQQKHRAHQIQRERRLPIIADPLRLQIRQRRLSLPVHVSAARFVEVAVEIHAARGAVELDGGFDQPGQEEDEEDEGAEHDEPWEQLAVLDQDEEEEEEEEG